MGIIILLVITIIVVVIIAKAVNNQECVESESSTSPSSTIEIELQAKPLTPEEPESKFHCTIAGVNYRENHVGAGVGISTQEPDNPYDKNAITIRTHTGRLIGYVPKAAHREYSKYFPDKANCFAIYEIYDTNGVMSGDAFFIRIHSWQYVWSEVCSLIEWFRKRRHVEVDFPESIKSMLENNANAEKQEEEL